MIITLFSNILFSIFSVFHPDCGSRVMEKKAKAVPARIGEVIFCSRGDLAQIMQGDRADEFLGWS